MRDDVGLGRVRLVGLGMWGVGGRARLIPRLRWWVGHLGVCSHRVDVEVGLLLSGEWTGSKLEAKVVYVWHKISYLKCGLNSPQLMSGVALLRCIAS